MLDIVMEDIPATSSLGGRRYYAYLPAGYLWELKEAYMMFDTGKAAGANGLLWNLYNSSDQIMAQYSDSAATVTQCNAMTLSTTVSPIVDCAAAVGQVYATYTTSGAGMTVGEGARIMCRFKARRPAVAA